MSRAGTAFSDDVTIGEAFDGHRGLQSWGRSWRRLGRDLSCAAGDEFSLLKHGSVPAPKM
jgi:hypothetical protein